MTFSTPLCRVLRQGVRRRRILRRRLPPAVLGTNGVEKVIEIAALMKMKNKAFREQRRSREGTREDGEAVA